jgi:CubicO group peptidase (beta-lactamase class C family)
MTLIFYWLSSFITQFILVPKRFYLWQWVLFCKVNKKLNVRTLVYFPALIILSVCLHSCQSSTINAEKSNTENSNITNSNITLIDLPKPIPLAKAESEKLEKACKKWYDSVLLPRGFNGGMIVAKNGNIVFEKYTGTIHIPGTDSLTAATPLHIASVSKTFTAMAVLKLWQDGKLNIDDELSKYIPAFNFAGVTIRCLLSHRSGLPNYPYFLENMGWDQTKIANNEDLLNFLITHKSTLTDLSPPNTHFSYCNTNYALLALLIEKVSGSTLSNYLQQTFFVPLNMHHTYLYTNADSLKMAPSYNWKGTYEPLNYLDAVYGDKNIYTTPGDLLIWDRALSSNKIFTAATLAHAYTPYSNEKPGMKNYGLGWRMNIYPEGKKIIFHNGWWHGSNATFIRLLKEDATIIIIGNKFTRAVYGAKILCNLFGNYYLGADDEEIENGKTTDSINSSTDSISVPTYKLSKKDSRMQELFKDKNKLNFPEKN